MKSYTLTKIGQLLYTTGAVKGKSAITNFVGLVDTGSTYTILPIEQLTAIGFEPHMAVGTARMVTASGHIVAPKFKVEWLSCLGVKTDSFIIVAHTLPSSVSGFGILGMDFLRKAGIQINIPKNRASAER